MQYAVSMRKAFVSWVTVVSDIEGSNLIEMIDSHRQEDIVKILRQQPFDVREQVEAVSVESGEDFHK